MIEKYIDKINKFRKQLKAKQNELESSIAYLKHDIKLKRLEIVKLAKENEAKSDIISKIKQKIDEANNQPQKAQIKWHEISLIISEYIEVEDHTFEIQMDEIHQAFIKKLKELYPLLTSQDLRLIVYIKIGMNAKEIAEVMHILPSSIYITRSRLRKKLNLNSNDDLYGFINRI